MIEFYKKNGELAQAEINKIDKSITQNSLARLAVIVFGAGFLFYTFQLNNVSLVLISTVVLVLLFFFLVNRQSRLEKLKLERMAFLRVNENEITLKQGRKTIYNQGETHEDGHHPYTSDLDIFGSYSLYTLVNRCATVLGNTILSNWFLKSSARDEILERQQAVAELAENVEWSQDFQSKLLFNLEQKIEIKSFLTRYFKDSAFNFGSTLLNYYVLASPFIFIAGVLVSVFIYPVWGYMAILALLHLFAAMSQAGRIGVFSSKIDKVGELLKSYADAIALVESRTWNAKRNKELQQKILLKDKKISSSIDQLSSLINKLDARNNMFMATILNIIFLWDFKQVMAIIAWKKENEDIVLRAFDVIAEIEALNSLAILKRNHPDWSTPTILANPLEDKLSCDEINHPLIHSDVAVANDYTNQDHRIALITGSNMAGKSTFLRTVGINAVLAYAGAVVCAKQFSTPIYSLISYMRIKDSLNESTSTFKAELDRMKYILQTVEADKTSFFIIDEMLRGTNSVDKYLGSKAIIKKLLSLEGKGMVATHDLQLASLADEYDQIHNFHFDIQVKEGEMIFDYKLKEGACTIFNASMLLKGIGIDVDKL
ncbi:MutS-related protein [Sphingobacterium hungaricum]